MERLNISADNPREQIMQIKSYLHRLVEELESILDSLDEKNLSSTFLERLDGMDANIHRIRDEMEERQQSLVAYVDRRIATLNTTTEGE